MQVAVMPRLSFMRRHANTICFAAIGLTSVIVFGFTVFGAFDNDITSSVVVGALASALFVDIAVVVSCWAERRARLMSRTIWAAVAIVLLAGTLALLNSGKTDADLLLTYGVSILAFPLGLIAAPIASQISPVAGPIQVTVIWVLAIGVGCLQWFFLLPMFVKDPVRD
jgi:hypothetical protein